MYTSLVNEFMHPLSDALRIRKVILKTIILFVAVFFARPSSAQDILILKSGRQMKVSIIEENADIVKYREYGDKTGPLYSVEKSMVEEIKYSRETLKAMESKKENNATENKTNNVKEEDAAGLLTVKKRFVYQGDKQLAPRSVRLTMEDNPEALRLYEKGRLQCRMSDACPGIMIFLNFSAGLIANRYDEPSDKMKILVPALVLDGGLIAAAIVFASSGKSNIRQSVTLYNSSLNAAKPLSFKTEAGFTGNGIGIRVKF